MASKREGGICEILNVFLDISERHLKNKDTFLDMFQMFVRLFCCLKKVTSCQMTRSVRVIYSRRLFSFGSHLDHVFTNYYGKGVVAFFHWI